MLGRGSHGNYAPLQGPSTVPPDTLQLPIQVPVLCRKEERLDVPPSATSRFGRRQERWVHGGRTTHFGNV